MSAENLLELRPRKEGNGVDAVLHGDLAEILSFCSQADRTSQPQAKASGGPLSVVAAATT
jgi:hypothetical protein